MKKEIESLIEKYERKLAYRKERLGREKEILERIIEKYENQECEYERLYNQQRSYAIQQDLVIEVVEILDDLKSIIGE